MDIIDNRSIDEQVIKNQQKRKVRTLLLIIVFVVGVFIGLILGVNSTQVMRIIGNDGVTVVDTLSGDRPMVSMDDFWEAWNLLSEEYPFDQPTTQEKIYGAIQGLVYSYQDPYTQFFPPKDAELFLEDISGQFGGVGIQLESFDGYVIVVSPLKGTPGYKAGILPGDIIVEVDGQSVDSLTIDGVVNKIRGEVGTNVELTILREGLGEYLTIVIKRDVIVVPILESEITDNNIGVVHFYSFTEGSSKEMKNVLDNFVENGVQGIILDLRGNPGGILDESITIAGYFLPLGSIVTMENTKEGITEEYRTSDTPIIPNEIDVVVLIDRGSASASEIVAGALKENNRAILVGEQSFGKGSVQRLYLIGNEGAALKYSIAEWLKPNHDSLNMTGLTPDIEVIIDSNAQDQDPNRDLIFERALQVFGE